MAVCFTPFCLNIFFDLHLFLLCASHFCLNDFWLLHLHLCKPSSQKCKKQLFASACLSVHMEQLGFHQRDFHESLYLSIFRKSIKKIEVSLKSDKNNWYFTWRPIQIFFLNHIWLVLHRMRNFSYIFLSKLKTHNLFSVTAFFRKSCHLWDNVEKYFIATQDTVDSIVHARCMMHTFVYKHMLRICTIYYFFTATVVTRTHLNVMLYLHCLSCFL
jgi:hypothetical protein